MFWIKAMSRFIDTRRRPEEMEREVETELRFHIEMRTRANVEQGMRPEDARRSALQSFGDFERVRNNCCEIRRSLPINYTLVKMSAHITIALVAGLAALWAVNVQHDNFTGVLRQLIAIAVLGYLFIVVQRARSKWRADTEHVNNFLVAHSLVLHADKELNSDTASEKFIAYDEQGRTPVERVFKS